MNKKGQQEEGYGETGDAIKVITMLVASTIMALFLVGITNQAIAKQLTADKRVDEFLIFEAMRHCFLYEKNGRVYYDTINPELFNDERLSECLPDIDAAASLMKMDGTQVKSVSNGAGSIISSASYSYIVNVLGSDEMHILNVITLRLT